MRKAAASISDLELGKINHGKRLINENTKKIDLVNSVLVPENPW